MRAAISAQGMGLLDDIGRQIDKVARDLDDAVERILRRIFFRRRRPLPTNRAGAVSRGLAFAIDALFVNLSFTVLAGAITLLATFFGGNGNSVPRGAVAAGLLRLAGRRRHLPGRVLVAGRADAGDALPRDPIERTTAAVRPRDPPADRPRPLGDHLRDRLPRHRLRRIAARLGRPHGPHRSRLRRAPSGPGALVEPERAGAAAGVSAGLFRAGLSLIRVRPATTPRRRSPPRRRCRRGRRRRRPPRGRPKPGPQSGSAGSAAPAA